MKKSIFIFFFSFFLTVSFAQNPALIDTRYKNEKMRLNTSQLRQMGNDSLPMKKIEPLLDALVKRAIQDNLNVTDKKGGLRKDAILIVVMHPLNYKGVEDTTQVSMLMFRKNRAKSTRKLARDGKYVQVDTIYNRKKILVAFLGRQVNAKSFSVQKGESFFADNVVETADALLYPGIVKNIHPLTTSADQFDSVTMPLRFVRLDRNKLHSPCEISFLSPIQQKLTDDSLHTTSIRVTVKDDSSEVTFNVRPGDFKPSPADSSVYCYPVYYNFLSKYNPALTTNNLHRRVICLSDKEFYRDTVTTMNIHVHEKNYVAFNFGVSANLISAKYLSYINDSLSVNLDSSGQKQWQGAIYAGVMYYPFGRKIDNYGWIFRSPLSRLKERFGFFGGLQVSKTPFKFLYSGITMAWAKYVNIDVGFIWEKQYVLQSKYVPGVVSLQSAENLLRQKYSPTFYIGISFAPALIVKYLGLSGE